MATNLENKLAKLQRANEEYQAAKKKRHKILVCMRLKMDIDSLKDLSQPSLLC